MIVPLLQRLISAAYRRRSNRVRPFLEQLECRVVPTLIRLPPVLVNPGNPSQGVDGGDETLYSPPAIAVAEDAAGDFVVVWTTTPDNTAILAQRFGPTGNPLGSVITVASNIYPSDAYPHISVAMDATGNFVVAWDNEGQVFADRFDASGNNRDSGGLLIDSDGSTPSVALDGQGEFLVAYLSDTDSGEAVLARRGFLSGPNALDPNGSFAIASSPYYTYTFYESAAVAADSAGDFVVAYQSVDALNETLPSSVYAQRVDAMGDLVGSTLTLSTSGVAVAPAVAMASSSGNFAVTWIEANSTATMMAETFTVDGTVLASPFQVSSTSEPPSYQGYDSPGVAADANGTFVAVWAVHQASEVIPSFGIQPDDPPPDNDPTGDVFAQSFTSVGSLTGDMIDISTASNAPGPTGVAMDPAGEFVVVYTASEQVEQTDNGPSATGNAYDEIAVIFHDVTLVPPPPPPSPPPPAPPPPPVVPPIVMPAQPASQPRLDPALSIALGQGQNQEDQEQQESELIPIEPPKFESLLEVLPRFQPVVVARRIDSAAVALQETGGTEGIGAISGQLFADLSGDGVFAPNKPPLAGRLIFLDLNNNGQLDDGEPVTVTNNNGEYSFNGLPLKTYQVRQLLLRGDVQTLPAENAAWEVRLDSSSRDIGGRNFGNVSVPIRAKPKPLGAVPGAAPSSTAPRSEKEQDDPDDDGDD